MKIEGIYEYYKQSYKVVKDTRDDVRDAIYFSLKGESFDGNRYAKDAIEKGASYAIVDDEDYCINEQTILVEDALKCLQDLARYHRLKLGVPIFALTGSNGKTTTKELLNAVMQQKFNCQSTQGNLNNHIGVPLTLLSIRPEHEFGVVEMGANHIGEIEMLCDIAMPDYGLITNFGRVHLEGFRSFEGVIQGKTEMYRFLRAHNRVVFVNAADPLQVEHADGIKQVTFGTEDADFPSQMIGADPFVELSYPGNHIESNLIGAYNYNNIAMATAAGRYFEVGDHLIKKAIENYVPSNNRSQIIDKDSNKIILDAYNANPNSMEAAILNFANLSDNNKVAILGDMFEVGDGSHQEHQRIDDLLHENGIEQAMLIGEHFNAITVSSDKFLQFKTFQDFQEYFETLKIQNTTFLIKASRGMKLERVLDFL